VESGVIITTVRLRIMKKLSSISNSQTTRLAIILVGFSNISCLVFQNHINNIILLVLHSSFILWSPSMKLGFTRYCLVKLKLRALQEKVI